QNMQRYPRLGRQQPHNNFDFAHFQAEYRTGQTMFQRSRTRKVHGDSRLPQTRPSRHNDQLSAVESPQQPNEIRKPGRDTGHSPTSSPDRFNLVQCGLEKIVEDRIILTDPLFGDVINSLLGKIYQVINVTARPGTSAVAELHNPGTGLHQPPQNGPLGDNP